MAAGAVLLALARDFRAPAHAGELAAALGTLRDALGWVAPAPDVGSSAWLQRARAPLDPLGVR
jgi:hypothetical protein